MTKLCNLIHVLVSVFICLLLIVTSGMAVELELSAKAAILMDARSGRILYSDNIDQPLPIASISKLMTLVLVLEALEEENLSFDDLVTTSEKAASMGGSQVWLEVGEQLTLKEMLYAIAVGSANDASVAVAEYMAGSEAAFVNLMNQKAQKLGLENSEFSNSSGLPPNLLGSTGRQVMSARDVANLARHSLDVPFLLDLVSTYEYTMRPDGSQKPVLWNYNKMLRRYAGMDGLKTGFTTEAAYCLAATANREGLRLIAVVLGSTSDAKRESDITKLLDYGFREYSNFNIFSQDSIVGELILPKGEQQFINAIVQQDFGVTVKRGEQDRIVTEIIFDDQIEVPLNNDVTIGRISAYLDDQLLAQAEIKPEHAVGKADILDLMIRITGQIVQILTEGS